LLYITSANYFSVLFPVGIHQILPKDSIEDRLNFILFCHLRF